LTGAFKSQPDTIVIPPQWWPKMPTLENFQQLIFQLLNEKAVDLVEFFAKYFPKVLSLSFEAKLDEQDVKVTTTHTLSNINSVGEITVPEEVLNSNN